MPLRALIALAPSQHPLPARPCTPAGVGYSVIPGNQLNGGAAFNLAKPGAGCVEQGGSTAWGSYSGIDVHFPSYKVWSAVEYAFTKTDFISASNAGIWLNVFA